MPAPNIRDIITADSYRGEAALGGALDTAINIDSRPIRELAQYTYYYNKNMYDQQQRDAEIQAAKLADLTAYDLNTAIPKDRELIQKQYDDLYNYVQKNPNVLDYKNNPKGWLEYNKKKNDFTNNLKGAKTRSILYLTRQEEISVERDTRRKALLETELNQEANSTDLKTPLRATQQYNTELPKLPQATGIKVPVAVRNANDIFDEEHEVWNGRAARDKGNVFALGLNEVVDETTPEGKRKAIERKNNFWLQGAEVFNSAVGSAKDANGILDETKVKGVALDLVNLAKRVNAYNANKITEIQAGLYGNTLRPEDYSPINYADGISADELAVIADFSTWKGDNVTRKIVETNDANEAANRALTRRGQDLDYALGSAKLNLDKQEFKLKETQFKASQVGSATQVNGAMERAKRIYKDLEGIAGKDGVIGTEDIRKLNSEQLKYLGIEQKDAEGKLVYTPLDLKERNADGEVKGDGKYAIELKDGNIRVLADAQLNPTTRKYGGLWDNTKSTNIYNVATNILNEELSKAGTKELNTYWGIDVLGGNTSFTDNQSSSRTSSSTAAAVSGTVKVQGPNGKIYNVPAADVTEVLKANQGAKIIP